MQILPGHASNFAEHAHKRGDSIVVVHDGVYSGLQVGDVVTFGGLVGPGRATIESINEDGTIRFVDFEPLVAEWVPAP